MKKYHKTFFIRLLSLVAVTGLCISVFSCQPEGLTESAEFTLYYTGITDIGPSTSMSVSPTWHGKTPTDFEIYKVTYDGQNFSSEANCFSVDADGVVSIQNTKDLQVGKYAISIACRSNGKRFEFPDAIVMDMMKAIPDGIVCDPGHITVTLQDMVSETGDKLPTAAIRTEGEHITVTKYLISAVRRDGRVLAKDEFEKLFNVSAEGVVSLKKGYKECVPGTYVLDFKLTTYVVNESSEDGIFCDALTVDITSAPLSLAYSPASGVAESSYAFISAAPDFVGSLMGIEFSIKSVEPACQDIIVDKETGVISIPAGNTLEIGSKYIVSITAKNDFGTKDFDNVYVIDVVEFIEPIVDFSYPVQEAIQAVAFASGRPDFTHGAGTVSFEFVSLPDELGGLEINNGTGVISAKKGHAIPIGEHKVTVRITNAKGSMETEFILKVKENPNYFTVVIWGNNLGLAPVENYDNQFRINSTDPYEMTFAVQKSDIPEGREVAYEVLPGFNSGFKDAFTFGENGTLVMNRETVAKNIGVYFIKVKVTVGGDDPAAITNTFYVFFHMNTPVKGATIEYTPFVVNCNSKTGGEIQAPVVNGYGDVYNIDYRRNFNYWNVGASSHVDGNKAESEVGGDQTKVSLLARLITARYPKLVNGLNAKRQPWTEWDTSNGIQGGQLLHYDKNGSNKIIIPANVWQYNNEWADGYFMGAVQMINNLTADPGTASGALQINAPLVIRFVAPEE